MDVKRMTIILFVIALVLFSASLVINFSSNYLNVSSGISGADSNRGNVNLVVEGGLDNGTE